MHDKIKSLYPDVRIIANTKNGGYGQGNNIGIRAASAPIVSIMNPDVRLIMPVFQTFIDVLSKDENIMCGGKQYATMTKQNPSFYYDFTESGFRQVIGRIICQKLDIYNQKRMWLQGAFFAIKKDNKLMKSANISSACPPSSRVSPVCYPQNPSGGDTLGSRTLSDVASLCHSLRWCKKITAHPQLRTLVWCSALPSSSPLLLAFRLRRSECLYMRAMYTPSAQKKSTPCGVLFCYLILSYIALISSFPQTSGQG